MVHLTFMYLYFPAIVQQLPLDLKWLDIPYHILECSVWTFGLLEFYGRGLGMPPWYHKSTLPRGKKERKRERTTMHLQYVRNESVDILVILSSTYFMIKMKMEMEMEEWDILSSWLFGGFWSGI